MVCWTDPRKPPLSLTEIFCKQQGKQSERQGLSISNTKGLSEELAVKVMVKALREAQVEWQHQQMQSQQRHGFLQHQIESSSATNRVVPVSGSRPSTHLQAHPAHGRPSPHIPDGHAEAPLHTARGSHGLGPLDTAGGGCWHLDSV